MNSMREEALAMRTEAETQLICQLAALVAKVNSMLGEPATRGYAVAVLQASAVAEMVKLAARRDE